MSDKKPATVFIVHRNDAVLPDEVRKNYNIFEMSEKWSLSALTPENFALINPEDKVVGVGYTKDAEDAFGFIDPDYEKLSMDAAKRFYARPTVAHFLGLLLGWSMVNEELESYDDGDGASWTRVDDECWYGDIDSVILNLVMPKDGGGACGCGSNYAAVLSLDKFLRTQMNHPFISKDEDDIRKGHLEDTVYREDLLGHAFWFIAYVMDAAGMTEHGSGIRHGWLQLKGVLLALLIGESIRMSTSQDEEEPVDQEVHDEFNPTKEKAMEAAIHLDKDLQMLMAGTWVPDRHSCEAALDNVGVVRRFIESK
ncbi:hypothetical protein PA10_00287 [Pseudomonas phage pPa_SNUABM_DT01]|nr:hypothetical protein PA10_00287 [Pseudomonas phage pPa_SNUABM_DT01]